MSVDTTSPVKVIVMATAALAGAWAIVSTYRRQHRLPLPPGPPEKSWLAGNAEDIPALFQWVKFTEWANKYGDVIHLRVHGGHLLVLSSYESIVDLFETRGQIYSDRPVRTMPFLMGWRDIVSFRDNDDRFKAFRRHVNIGFSKKTAVNYHAGQTKGVHVFLQRLLDNPDNLILELNRFAASFIMKATYGYSIVSDSDPYIMASDEAFKSLMTGSGGDYLVDSYPFLQYLPSWLPGMGFKRMAQEARKFPLKMAVEPFEWTKAQMNEGKAAHSLVRRLLEENEDGAIDEEAIMWTAATMYAGGVHTTVVALCNFIVAMMLHPHVARKAREEIDRVVGTERLPAMSDRAELPYLECVLSETLRWQPPTSMEVPHRVKQDDEYRGYRIPANSTNTADEADEEFNRLVGAPMHHKPIEVSVQTTYHRCLDYSPMASNSGPWEVTPRWFWGKISMPTNREPARYCFTPADVYRHTPFRSLPIHRIIEDDTYGEISIQCHECGNPGPFDQMY